MTQVKIRFNDKHNVFDLQPDMTLYELKQLITKKWNIKNNITLMFNFTTQLAKFDDEHDDKLLTELNIDNCVLLVLLNNKVKTTKNTEQIPNKQLDEKEQRVIHAKENYKKILKNKENDQQHRKQLLILHEEERLEAIERSHRFVESIRKEQNNNIH
jgi:beta-glucosidase-like glycosyl hydrolase